jgi:hypothetical protein
MKLTRKQRFARGLFSFLAALMIVAGFVFFVPDFLEACGTERWSVKTGTDPDAASVDLSYAWPTTVSEMSSWPRPGFIPRNNRVDPYEFIVWSVDATLIKFKSETDEDYHLVLMDDSGNTMIAEIPAPNCVGGQSPFVDYIANARFQFDSVFDVTGRFQDVSVPVTVTGVGFFDFAHGQTGRAPNLIELHPVLDIQFPE